MQHETYNRVTVSEVTDTKPSNEFPFDLNNLCNFNYSFEVLKKAIEYLAKQQRDQQALLADLIESSKTSASRPFEIIRTPMVTERQKSYEKEKERAPTPKLKVTEVYKSVDKTILQTNLTPIRLKTPLDNTPKRVEIKNATIEPEKIAEKVVVERIVEKVVNGPQKDWSPLMADIDRRLD